jgi:hypothetical protein
MPNRNVHTAVSTLLGVGVASRRARDLELDQAAAEILGAAIGGWCGGRLPDILEPPRSPGHRALAHSLTAGDATTCGATSLMNRWEEPLRLTADKMRRTRRGTENGFDFLSNWLGEFLLHVAVGFVTGLLVGYVSHLALDMITTRGLPIVQ